MDDKETSVSPFEKIEYINNSPQYITYIWFYFQPNAYKNDFTALAKKLLKLGSV